MTTNARDEKWSEWIDWSGGECPLPDGAMHEVEYQSGERFKDDMPETSYWGYDGDDCDIIAYRYKIKEPESDMHPDLKKIAYNFSVWPKWAEKVQYLPDGPNGAEARLHFVEAGSPIYSSRPFFFEDDVKAARQQLGLDHPEVTPEEDEAWQAKERQLIGSPRTAENFLHQAAELMAERGKQYDQPGGERSMGKAVAALNAITGRDLTEAEGWLLMSLVKRVRQHSGAGYHQDSAEDAVAYAALEAEALESARD